MSSETWSVVLTSEPQARGPPSGPGKLFEVTCPVKAWPGNSYLIRQVSRAETVHVVINVTLCVIVETSECLKKW